MNIKFSLKKGFSSSYYVNDVRINSNQQKAKGTKAI